MTHSVLEVKGEKVVSELWENANTTIERSDLWLSEAEDGAWGNWREVVKR